MDRQHSLGVPRALVLFLFLICVYLRSSAVQPLLAQREAPVPDPDPEVERKALQVADGFEVNLFAADPMLAKPIQMNFDAAGRLWVACSEAYPQIKPGQKANDRIIILEDTDGDGRADKTTVFADGLLIPTGLEPGDGGVYVANSTDLLHLADTDGDGKADRKRVVLSGFGTEDTHHLIHTLRWGPDGMLYFNQSIYIHSHVETPHGVRRLGGGGVWLFRPETGRLEVFVRGFWNPWGHHFDRWGQSFLTDGAGSEGVNPAVPGASYAATPHATRVLQGLNPGSPKYCGCEILSGRHLPQDWRGNLITNDFRGHRVCRFVLAPDGSGYSARLQADLIKTSHPAFRPVDVKMGPDGALYIADWYNPIIQHGEVDFRDPRRDVTHGRIWRVTAKGRPLVPRPQLVKAKVEDLLEALKAPEDWTRHHARRTLKERGAKAVLPALAAWVKRLDPAASDHEPLLLEALWTYQSLDMVEPKLLGTLLRARDYRVRAAATRCASAWHDRLTDVLGLLGARVADDHPQVRLEAVRALGQVPSVRAAELALSALDRPTDRYLDYGLWLTLRELLPYWEPALGQGKLNYGGNTRRLVFALEAAGPRGGVAPLAALVRAGKVPPEGEESVLTLLASLGGPKELALVLDRAASEKTPDRRRAALLAALEQAARQRGVRPEGDLGRVAALLQAEDDALRAAAARLAGRWRLESARPQLLDYAGAEGTSAALRQAVCEGLVALGGPASRDALDELAGAKGPFTRRRMALTALAGLDLGAASRRARGVLSASPGGEGAAEVFEAFLERKKGPELLAAALAGRKLPADVAKVGVRAVRTSGRDAPALLEVLTKAGGLTFGARTLSPREMRQMVADVARRGDPARGEAVFRRKDQLCLKCHAIGGAGGQVGPDLSSVGASAQVDYLIESLLEPNKAIKENYHSVLVTTTRGRLYTGIKVRQTKTELVLRTAEDQEVVIPVKDIDEQTPGRSLMPDGLTDTLTRGELVDLVRFLSELGKVGPYAVGRARVVRRWEALEATPEARRLLERGGPAAAAGGDPSLVWSPAYSTVAGLLALAEVPHLKVGQDTNPVAVLRCQLEATAASKVHLRLSPAQGVRLWLDGKPVAAREPVALDVPPGLHTLTVALDLGVGKGGLRCELADEAGSAGVRFVAGK
jgi:putative heme-binding domain-containing protein